LSIPKIRTDDFNENGYDFVGKVNQ